VRKNNIQIFMNWNFNELWIYPSCRALNCSDRACYESELFKNRFGGSLVWRWVTHLRWPSTHDTLVWGDDRIIWVDTRFFRSKANTCLWLCLIFRSSRENNDKFSELNWAIGCKICSFPPINREFHPVDLGRHRPLCPSPYTKQTKQIFTPITWKKNRFSKHIASLRMFSYLFIFWQNYKNVRRGKSEWNKICNSFSIKSKCR
jgi:hypothetical protein